MLHVNRHGRSGRLTIGSDVTIGHACIVHACKLEDFAFVGMGATVLDGAVIERGAMLAAGGLLTPGNVSRAGSSGAGRPARKMRDIPEADRAALDAIAVHYSALGLYTRSLAAGGCGRSRW